MSVSKAHPSYVDNYTKAEIDSKDTATLNSANANLTANGNGVAKAWAEHSYTASSSVSTTNNGTATGNAAITLSGVLDRIRITTVNGTDSFDSGTINVIYEG
jgi:hypothetical protein